MSSSTSRSRGVSSSSAVRSGWIGGGDCVAMRSITVRVTDGESSESPAATVWIGGEQLLGPGAFEQKAGGAGVDRAEDVVVLLEGGEDHHLDLG